MTARRMTFQNLDDVNGIVLAVTRDFSSMTNAYNTMLRAGMPIGNMAACTARGDLLVSIDYLRALLTERARLHGAQCHFANCDGQEADNELTDALKSVEDEINQHTEKAAKEKGRPEISLSDILARLIMGTGASDVQVIHFGDDL